MKCKICLYEGPFNKRHIVMCRFGGGKLVRHECPNCNVIFGTEDMINMSEEDLGAAYEKLYKSGHKESSATARQLNILKYLSPKPSGQYLNWGSGQSALVKPGITVSNYDPYIVGNEPILNDKLDLQVYDGIMSCNFIEHLQDPVEVLKNMLNYLKPAGVMAHGTPCYRYKYEYTKFHLYFFLGKSVDIMAARAGLIAVRTSDPDVILYKGNK